LYEKLYRARRRKKKKVLFKKVIIKKLLMVAYFVFKCIIKLFGLTYHLSMVYSILLIGTYFFISCPVVFNMIFTCIWGA
jgi:hypothetical protein